MHPDRPESARPTAAPPARERPEVRARTQFVAYGAVRCARTPETLAGSRSQLRRDRTGPRAKGRWDTPTGIVLARVQAWNQAVTKEEGATHVQPRHL